RCAVVHPEQQIVGRAAVVRGERQDDARPVLVVHRVPPQIPGPASHGDAGGAANHPSVLQGVDPERPPGPATDTDGDTVPYGMLVVHAGAGLVEGDDRLSGLAL